jgi:hypothetical protein
MVFRDMRPSFQVSGMTTSESDDASRRAARLARSVIRTDAEELEVVTEAAEPMPVAETEPSATVSPTPADQLGDEGQAPELPLRYRPLRRTAGRVLAWRHRRSERRSLDPSELQPVIDSIAALEHRTWLHLNHIDHKIDNADHRRWLEANHVSVELRSLGALEYSVHTLAKDVEALAEMLKELLLQMQVAQRSATIGGEAIANAVQEVANRLDVIGSPADDAAETSRHRGSEE